MMEKAAVPATTYSHLALYRDCWDGLQGEGTKPVLKIPVGKGLCYSALLYKDHASLCPHSQHWQLLAPSPPLQPKSSKCCVRVPKGCPISQNCSCFTETLNFHIFTKSYLYIRCANELISRVNKEPVTHPPADFPITIPFIPNACRSCNEHLLSTRHHSATPPALPAQLSANTCIISQCWNVLNIHHHWCSIRIN